MAGPVFAGLNGGGALEHNNNNNRDLMKSSHLHKELDVSWQLQYLLEQNPSRRVEILHNMRKTLRKHGGNLPIFNKYAVFEAFYHILGDSRWKVSYECCMLITEIIPLTGEDLDSCMLIILPRVIPNLGHDHVDVRRATLKVLHTYGKYTNNLQRFLRVFVQYGLESSDLATRKGCILSIPLLFTDEFANENLFILVESLCELMVNADNNTFYPIFLALQKLHNLVGPEVFKAYLKQVNPDAATLYMRVLKNSTSYDDGLVLFNNKLAVADSIDDRRVAAILHSSSMFKPHILEFGLFESSAIDKIKQGEWRDRIEGVGHIKMVLKESMDLSPLSPHMEEFLTFLSRILEDTNFKVTVLALDVIEVLIEKLKSRIKHYIRPFASLLFKHLGDSRIVVREHNVRVLHKFMHEVPPQLVLDILLESRHHRNPRLREEIINRVTAAVLTFPSSDFDFTAICQAVAPLLIDTRRHVRLATLECFAVLAQAMGPSKLSPLVSAVDAVELNSDCDGLMTAVQSRLARRVLPRCTVDGMVLYALSLPNLTNGLSWTGSSMGADVDWVMLASSTSSSSSSNSGTPPSRPLPDILPVGSGFTPPSTSGSDTNSTVASYSENITNQTGLENRQINDTESDWQATKIISDTYDQDSADSTKVEFDDDDKQTISGSADSEPNQSSHPESPFSLDLESVTSKDTNGTGSAMGTVLLPNRVKISSAGAVRTAPPPSAPERVMSVGEAMNLASNMSGSADGGVDQSPIPLRPTLARTQSGRRRYRASSEPSVAILQVTKGGAESALNDDRTRERNAVNSNPVLSSLEELRLDEKGDHHLPKLASVPPHSASSPPRSFSADLASHMAARSSNRRRGFPDNAMPFPDRPILVRSPSFGRVKNQSLQDRTHSLDSVANVTNKASTVSQESNDKQDNSDSKSDQTPPSTSGSDFSSDQDLNKSIARMTRENIIQRQQELLKDPEDRMDKKYEQLQQQNSLDEESSVGSIEQQHIKEEDEEEEENDGDDNEDDDEEEESEKGKNDAKNDVGELENAEGLEEANGHEVLPVKHVTEKATTYKEKPKVAAPDTAVSAKPGTGIRSSGKTPILRRRQRIPPSMTRSSHSVPPSTRLHTTTLTLSNLENLTNNSSPEEAVKSIMQSLSSDNWSTKTAAMRTVRQIVNNNPMILQGTLHQLILALVAEVKNLRSSVARSAISTLGVMFANLKRAMEVELDTVVQTLLQKSGENVSFIREDIEKTLSSMVDSVSPIKAAMALINGGAKHRNGLVRRTAANFISLVVDRMGPIRCLEGPKELREQLLPATAQFVMDGSPVTRYYGRRIFQLLMVHPNFDHLLRRYVQPATLRNISTIMDTIRKKGVGERPLEGNAGKVGLRPDFSSLSKTM